MASRASPKRTDTNWLRGEILSEFSKLLETLSSKLRAAGNNRDALQESYENVKIQIAAAKEELMADLRRLHAETIKAADKVKEVEEERIRKYEEMLELKNKSITASVDRISHNKSIFSAQKEMEYLQTAQNEIANINPLEARTMTFKRSNTLSSLARQQCNLGSVDIVDPSNSPIKVAGEENVSQTFRTKPQMVVEGGGHPSVPAVVANGDQSTTDPLKLTLQPSPSDVELAGASYPLPHTYSNHRTFTWVGKFRLNLSERHKVTDACCLNSIAVLDNKVIAVCDSPHDCIQLFNGNYELLEEMECKRPRGICTVDRDTFGVSIHSEPIIKLLSVNQTSFAWTNDIKIACKSWIRDIKQAGKCMYLLCDDGDIHKTNLKGKTEKVFPTRLGKHQCRHLCVSKDANMFYVSSEEAVICMDKDGKQIWKYSDVLGMTEGRGISVFDNNVFVSDWKNSSLIELTKDGKVANVIKDIGYPYAMHIVEGERFGKLFVTQFSRFVSRDTRRCVHVYRVGKAKETK